ncbi:MAG: hypothetical protein CL608_21540 [Anaerolineaceae bacterium]|nr:hypothetical protein [Anaerolineaceae bacterium]
MLETLRNRVIKALKAETAVTLSTNGPGGIQAGFFPSEGDGLILYLLVPASSDILFNLESETAVVITTPHWQMEGEAAVCTLLQAPPTLTLARSPQVEGCVLVAVQCHRIHFNWTEGWGYRETIDCNGR